MRFFSATLVGVQPIPVEVEIDLSSGLPYFQIVGLPDAILKESKTRVKSAILQAGFKFPFDRRLVLNLAPSKIKKEGSGCELAIAARILAASEQIPVPDCDLMFLGELALDGTVKAVEEMEALLFAAVNQANVSALVVPECFSSYVPKGLNVVKIKHLNDLRQDNWWKRATEINPKKTLRPTTDWSHLSFSEFWARQLKIAAVGRHHYFLCGPPGCGKTFFAEGLRMLLDSVRDPEELSVDQRVLNCLFKRHDDELPWAAPHHSATSAGLLGGGLCLQPGALTRAHGGVLFLDELLEFSPSSMDSLREPIEKGIVEIFRAGQSVSYPSRVQVIAATNPCRCGYWRHPIVPCACTPRARQVYLSRMSGPFFDRFEAKIFCSPPLLSEKKVAASVIRDEIADALEFVKGCGKPRFHSSALKAIEKFQSEKPFSYRSSCNVKAVSQTIAIIEGRSEVIPADIDEALNLNASTPETPVANYY